MLLNIRKLGLGTKKSISYKPGKPISPSKNVRRLMGMKRDIYAPWAIRASRLLHLKYGEGVSYAACYLHIEGHSGKEMNEHMGVLFGNKKHSDGPFGREKGDFARLRCWMP